MWPLCHALALAPSRPEPATRRACGANLPATSPDARRTFKPVKQCLSLSRLAHPLNLILSQLCLTAPLVSSSSLCSSFWPADLPCYRSRAIRWLCEDMDHLPLFVHELQGLISHSSGAELAVTSRVGWRSSPMASRAGARAARGRRAEGRARICATPTALVLARCCRQPWGPVPFLF